MSSTRCIAKSLRSAIIGDIFGSVFEGSTVRGNYPDCIVTGFPRNSPLLAQTFLTGEPLVIANAELPAAGACVTDDTILSFAVADHHCRNVALAKSLKAWFAGYPAAAYGAGFRAWAQSKETRGQSFGNGAAMRVSPLIDLAVNADEALALARASALPTHDHGDAIEGAQAIAFAGYIVKSGACNQELKKQLGDKFPQIATVLDRTLDELRPVIEFSVTAKDTVPIAIAVFLESESLDDLYRKSLSMGGDVDTIATMAASIGAYRYELTEIHQRILDQYLDNTMKEALDRFESFLVSPGNNIDSHS